MEGKIMSFQRDIDHLEAYLVDKYDIYVAFGYNDPNSCSELDRVITINSRQSPQTRLYTLLHEAGHFVLFEERDSQKLFPNIIYQPFGKRFTQANAIDVIRNEVMAWEEGRNLAFQLGIEIDDKRWNSMRKKCLYDYCKWAVGDL